MRCVQGSHVAAHYRLPDTLATAQDKCCPCLVRGILNYPRKPFDDPAKERVVSIAHVLIQMVEEELATDLRIGVRWLHGESAPDVVVVRARVAAWVEDEPVILPTILRPYPFTRRGKRFVSLEDLPRLHPVVEPGDAPNLKVGFAVGVGNLVQYHRTIPEHEQCILAIDRCHHRAPGRTDRHLGGRRCEHWPGTHAAAITRSGTREHRSSRPSVVSADHSTISSSVSDRATSAIRAASSHPVKHARSTRFSRAVCGYFRIASSSVRAPADRRSAS